MGRPIKRQEFLGTRGGVNVTHQIQSLTWGAADSAAVPGHLAKQNSPSRFVAHTNNGRSLTTLSNGAPTSAGFSAVKVFPVGSDPLIYASATANLKVVSASIVSGGNLYSVGNVLTLSGGVFGNAATITVNSVFANNAVNAFTLNAVANEGYKALPANIAAVATTTAGNGAGAIFNVNFGLESVAVVSGGSNYTSANITFPQAKTAPVTTNSVIGGVLQNNVAVTSAGVINIGNPTVVVEGTSGNVEYVKQIRSAEKLLTFSGNEYFWLPKGVQPPANWANLSVKFAYLDTL